MGSMDMSLHNSLLPWPCRAAAAVAAGVPLAAAPGSCPPSRQRWVGLLPELTQECRLWALPSCQSNAARVTVKWRVSPLDPVSSVTVLT